jgi:nucleoside-diphosphate-sugar epimerase
MAPRFGGCSEHTFKGIMNDKIILAGGSGFLGGALASYFTALKWKVVVLTRHPAEAGC